MEYNKDIKTGIKKLDEEHQKIFRNIKKLKSSVENDAPSEEIYEIIKSLDFYISEHFKYEEELAEKANFYKLKKLKESHREFKKAYEMFKRTYESYHSSSCRVYAIHLSSSMQNWIISHFKDIDQELIYYLKDSKK